MLSPNCNLSRSNPVIHASYSPFSVSQRLSPQEPRTRGVLRARYDRLSRAGNLASVGAPESRQCQYGFEKATWKHGNGETIDLTSAAQDTVDRVSVADLTWRLWHAMDATPLYVS